ncbi:hypothetical protein KEM52_006370 [Ascosphaera acerosa]|nr:hypothetical protein KEM52_006370 [Ascosphaera acerosa]
MAALTQFVYLRSKNGVNVAHDASFQRFTAAVKELPGVKHLSWGPTEEKDATYDTVIAIETSTSTRLTLPLSLLEPLIDDSLQFCADLTTRSFSEAVFAADASTTTTTSPFVCELVALAYPRATTDRAALTAMMNELLDQLCKLKETAPAHHYTSGLLIDPPPRTQNGQKIETEVVYSVVQWDSVQAHMDARGTETFAKYIAPLRKDMIFAPWQMRHVRFTKVF